MSVGSIVRSLWGIVCFLVYPCWGRKVAAVVLPPDSIWSKNGMSSWWRIFEAALLRCWESAELAYLSLEWWLCLRVIGESWTEESRGFAS